VAESQRWRMAGVDDRGRLGQQVDPRDLPRDEAGALEIVDEPGVGAVRLLGEPDAGAACVAQPADENGCEDRGVDRVAHGVGHREVFQLQLLPRWIMSPDFRLAFTSGVSANSVCFERELLDHYRLVFEKKPSPSG
jgi:hypothetical protein